MVAEGLTGLLIQCVDDNGLDKIQIVFEIMRLKPWIPRSSRGMTDIGEKVVTPHPILRHTAPHPPSYRGLTAVSILVFSHLWG
jgi:hypothetical protein